MNEVKSINISEARKLLKDCPRIVQDYVTALEEALTKQRELTTKAIRKINELSSKVKK